MLSAAWLTAATSNPFGQAILGQEGQPTRSGTRAAFESWYFTATSKKLNSREIAANQNLFSTRLLQTSLNFTAFQVQE